MAQTKLTDSTESFVLGDVADGENQVLHKIEQSAAKSEHLISQSFTVADETKSFTTGSWRLELILSDPHRHQKLRSIVYYDLDIQISDPYEYRDKSQFLLVVNASTKNEGILEMRRFIRSELHLSLDIFNISLAGTFIDEESHRSILHNYIGKSIIICGSRVQFFGHTERYNWQLIDPHDMLHLTMNHTGILICDVVDAHAEKSLSQWTQMLNHPVSLRASDTVSCPTHTGRHALLQALEGEADRETFSVGLEHQFKLDNNFRILRRVFQGNTDKRLRRGGEKLAKRLDSELPMRRFVVTTIKQPGVSHTAEEAEEETPSFSMVQKLQKKYQRRNIEQQDKPYARSVGIISVTEGLSKTACCLISHSPIVDDQNVLTNQQMKMMIASFPFYRLSIIFWNIVCSISGNTVGAEAFYRNVTNLELYFGSSGSSDEETDLESIINGEVSSLK
jgi:hypothetical protein